MSRLFFIMYGVSFSVEGNLDLSFSTTWLFETHMCQILKENSSSNPILNPQIY